MSKELKDRLLRIEAMCKGNSGVCKDIAFEARMALQAVDSQQLTVIAPPLEWGERKGRFIQSKCGLYDLRFVTEGEGWRAWSNHDKAFTPLNQSPVTEIEAKATCQAHAQATVTRALEGCNVILYRDRDPQGLVDALEFELIYAKTMSDMSEFKDSPLPKRMKLLNDSVIKMLEMFKAWEEGK